MRECCICFGELPAADVVALVPCGHRCVCEPCAAALLRSNKRLCPYCEVPAASWLRVYDVLA